MSVRILHWSDNHNDMVPTQATIAAYNASNDIDMFINTGDIVADVYENPINACEPLNTCLVMGNHDAFLQIGADPNGYQWDKVPSLKQKYDKFFAPNAALPQMHRGDYPYATWWHHDFNTVDRLTILGLDYTVQGDDIQAQTDWLTKQIKRCVEEDRAVIIANHHYAVGPIVVDTNYNNSRYTNANVPLSSMNGSKWYPSLQANYYQICKACDKQGLNVVLWMCGHTHADTTLVSQTIKPFPIISVTSTILYTNNEYWFSNLNRIKDPDYANCVATNLYDYDRQRGTLQIYRLGANQAVTGKIRNMLIWDYNQDRYLDNSFSRFPE